MNQKGFASLLGIVIASIIMIILMIIGFNIYKERMENASELLKEEGFGDESNIYNIQDIIENIPETRSPTEEKIKELIEE